MSHSFLVLQALLHSDETTDTAAVSLINKHECVCRTALTAAAAGAEQIVLGSWVSVLQSKRVERRRAQGQSVWHLHGDYPHAWGQTRAS